MVMPVSQAFQIVTDWGDLGTRSVSQAEVSLLQIIAENNECTGAMLLAESVVADGTVYTTLKRMVSKGFLESRSERRVGQRGRALRFYRVTSYGIRTLEAVLLAANRLETRDYTHTFREPIDRPRARTRSKISGKARTAAGG